MLHAHIHTHTHIYIYIYIYIYACVCVCVWQESDKLTETHSSNVKEMEGYVNKLKVIVLMNL